MLLWTSVHCMLRLFTKMNWSLMVHQLYNILMELYKCPYTTAQKNFRLDLSFMGSAQAQKLNSRKLSTTNN